MAPFRPTTSSIGNKKRLKQFYKKNTVKPVDDDEQSIEVDNTIVKPEELLRESFGDNFPTSQLRPNTNNYSH